MPIRRGPAAMGVVEITSITQVIEWSSLASIVAVGTRMIVYEYRIPLLLQPSLRHIFLRTMTKRRKLGKPLMPS